MSWQATLFVLPTLFAVAIALLLSGYALVQLKDGDREPIVVLFFWITVATVVWAGFSALKLLHTNPETKLLFYRLLHVGAATLPPLLFLFVVAYTDRTRWLQPVFVGSVFLLPGVFIVLLFVDPANIVIAETALSTNGLTILRVSDGPGFLVFLAYSTVLVVAALALFVTETRRIGTTYYPQALLLGIAVLTPILFGLLTAVSVPPFTDERINLVPTSAAVSTTALGLLLVRYRLFEVPPLAYTTAMKYSPDGLLVLDRDNRIVHANDRGHDLLDQLGGDIGDVLTRHLPEFDPATASGESVERQTTTGEPTYERLLVEPLRRGGRAVGWVVVFRDETTQQRQQRLLEQQNEQLEQFASVVSHDLRNPLNVAQLRLDLARQECDSEHLDEIHQAHDRMGRLIDDLLTLAREGQQVSETEPVTVDELATTCWQSVETANATLHTRIDHTIYADWTRFQQLFENLIRNAVEHGGETVTITVGELAEGFYFADDGPGIAVDDRENVFETGYSTATDGTGLGLSIVGRIVDAHGWDIRVTDGSDGGARFEITGVEFVE